MWMKYCTLNLVCINFFSFFPFFLYKFHVYCKLHTSLCCCHAQCTMRWMQWHHCGSFLLCFLYLLSTANVLKLCTTWTIYFMKQRVFWYHNMLTTHGLANTLVQCQPSPERARWGRCNLVLHDTAVFTYNTATLCTCVDDLKVHKIY
jgi:hypothetical protein